MAVCRPPFSKGQKVEVRVDEDGFYGAWFEAVVCRTLPATRRHSVIYDSLFLDGQPSIPLMETVTWDNVRPRPPCMFPPPRLQPRQDVEAYHNDGWWPGFVSEVVEAETGGNNVVWYTVTFPYTGEVVDRFGPQWVRPRLCWDGRNWVPASSSSSSPPRLVSETMAMDPNEARGTPKSAEVNVEDEALLPSLKEKIKHRTTDKPEEARDKSNEIQYVKTLPPPLQMGMVGKRKKKSAFRPLRRGKRMNLGFLDFQQKYMKTKDPKDSKQEFSEETSIGHNLTVNTKNPCGSTLPVEDGAGNHEQVHKSTEKHVPLQTDATTEHVPPDHTFGSFQQDAVFQENTLKEIREDNQRITSANGNVSADTSLKQIISDALNPVQQTPCIVKEVFSISSAPDLTTEVTGIDKVQPGDTITGTLAHDNNTISSLEGQSNCSPSAEHDDGNDWHFRSETELGSRRLQPRLVNNDNVRQNICMVSELLSKGCNTSSNHSHQFSKTVGDNVASQMPLCSDMDGNREKVTVVPPPNEVKLPFTKASPVWETLQSMELYRALPQQPHFRPLEQQPEDLREGEAIGIILSFDSFVCSTRRLNISDPKVVFDQKLEKLHFFENHGFDVGFVKEELKGLLQAKGDNKNKITELRKQISDRQKEMAELHGRVEALDMTLVEFRKISTKFEEARASTILLLVKKESEIGKLQEEVNEATLSLR